MSRSTRRAASAPPRPLTQAPILHLLLPLLAAAAAAAARASPIHGAFVASGGSAPTAAAKFRPVFGSSSSMEERPPVPVRPRPAFDPSSPSPPSSPTAAKDAFWDSVDAVASVGSAIGGAVGRKKPEQPAENASVLKRPVGGYGDTVEAGSLPKRRREGGGGGGSASGGLLGAKEAAFAAADGIRGAAEAVAGTSARAVEAVDGTVRAVAAIPEAVEETVDTVQEVGGKVRRAADGTADFARGVVTDVRNIPGTVAAKVDETRRTVERTKQTAEKVASTVSNAAHDVQAMLGVRSRRPVPPPPPPPPPPEPTLEEQGGRAVRSVAESTARLAWFAAKGSVGLGVAATRAAVGATMGGSDRKEKEEEAEKGGAKESSPAAATGAVGAEVPSSPRTAESPGALSDIDPTLGREVKDALEAAEAALSSSEVERPPEVE